MRKLKITQIVLMSIFCIFLSTCQEEDLSKESHLLTEVIAKPEVATPHLKSATIPDQLQKIIFEIEIHVMKQRMTEEDGHSLTVKIMNAKKSYEKENFTPIVGQLGAFINEVQYLVDMGLFDSKYGLILINMAKSGITLAKFRIEFPEGTFTDPRDGYKYSVVPIGNQTWMAENLKATLYNDMKEIPTAISYGPTVPNGPAYDYYNSDIINRDIYGALYSWYTVETGKLCPVGWHVPSNSDWDELANALGGIYVAGGKMKEVGLAHWLAPNTGATNESGFNALPGGWGFHWFWDLHEGARFWSSDAYNDDWAYYTTLLYNSSYFGVAGATWKGGGRSIRCVKD